MTRFVVISGKKQVGKNTLATMIADELVRHGKTVKEVSFADPLKRICHIAFGIPMEWMYGTDEDKERLTDVMWDGLSGAIRLRYSNRQMLEPVDPAVRTIVPADNRRDSFVPAPRTGPMTVREVLQVIGSDIFREMIDVDVWAKAPFRAEHVEDFVLIPDGRFPNEVVHGREHGLVLRAYRDTGLDDGHMSETALDDLPIEAYHRTVNNQGTKNELREFAREIVRDLLG